MSLINDALKRAQEALESGQQTPSAELHFRGVDPQQGGPKGFGWKLPAGIGGCVVITVIAVWLIARSHGASDKDAAMSANSELKVHAREQEPTPTAPVSATTPQETNAPALNDLPPAKPRLQGIIFNPKRPSATISGQMVFVGDKVGDWRVVSIGKDNATLMGADGMRVLKLGE